ncbi:MAG: DUF2959 family protein [Planctomycetes bacterium]|nr:DUF2959 family protein [Planctomycetota bacterium]
MGKARWQWVALSCAALGLTSCAELQQALRIGSGPDAGIEEVDTLLGRIELVYVECERAELCVAQATTRLHALVRADFDADPTESFASFDEAIRASEVQADLLESSVSYLEKTANAFFRGWEEDLKDFQSETLRERSRARLEETRERYRALTTEVGPAVPVLRGFNTALRDQALFLQNDFNAASVRALSGDVREATDVARSLTEQFSTAREAARTYVEQAALRGQIDEPRDEVAARR